LAAEPDTSGERTRTIKTDYLARVEGEGAMSVRIRGDEVEQVRLEIYEPPRFFEAFLRGRSFSEAPDITARICGICPVAYMTSAFNAIDHREVVEGGLKIKAMGNEILRTIGGRAIHPINVRVGGFYKAPTRRDLEGLRPELEEARELARVSVDWVSKLDFPEFEQDYEFVALSDPDTYAIEDGRLISSGGLEIGPGEYEEHFTESQVEHSTALHSRLRDGGTYFCGPMARYALGSEKLSPLAREAAERAGLGPVCRNPFQSIVVRAVEILYAFDEALRLIDAYEPPEEPGVEVEPRAASGCGWSEAPRGMLWHRYRLEENGSIAEAKIVPPTSQNQARIEQDLLEFVRPRVELSDERLQWECEQAIRNYDPCISCSAHFLKLDVERA
jgi:coenzyme F420-reducing hydrogenase alpha subunit